MSSFYKLFTSEVNKKWVYGKCVEVAGPIAYGAFSESFERYADELYRTNQVGSYRNLIEGRQLLDQVHYSNWDFIDYYSQQMQFEQPLEVDTVTVSDGRRSSNRDNRGKSTDEILADWKDRSNRPAAYRDDFLENSADDSHYYDSYCGDDGKECYDDPTDLNTDYAERIMFGHSMNERLPGFGQAGDDSNARLLSQRTFRTENGIENGIPLHRLSTLRRFVDKDSASESMRSERVQGSRGYDMSGIRNRADIIRSRQGRC